MFRKEQIQSHKHSHANTGLKIHQLMIKIPSINYF